MARLDIDIPIADISSEYKAELDALRAENAILRAAAIRLHRVVSLVALRQVALHWPCVCCGRAEDDPPRLVGYATEEDGSRPTKVSYWTGCFVCNEVRPLAEKAREALETSA